MNSGHIVLEMSSHRVSLLGLVCSASALHSLVLPRVGACSRRMLRGPKLMSILFHPTPAVVCQSITFLPLRSWLDNRMRLEEGRLTNMQALGMRVVSLAAIAPSSLVPPHAPVSGAPLTAAHGGLSPEHCQVPFWWRRVRDARMGAPIPFLAASCGACMRKGMGGFLRGSALPHQSVRAQGPSTTWLALWTCTWGRSSHRRSLRGASHSCAQSQVPSRLGSVIPWGNRATPFTCWKRLKSSRRELNHFPASLVVLSGWRRPASCGVH